MQKYAPQYYKRLHYEHFPGSHPSIVASACEQTLDSMFSALRGSANDGILFAGGDAGLLTCKHRDVIGEGSVKRSTCPELQEEFSSNNFDGLDDWARCYEWTHWSSVMTALGKCQCLIHFQLVIELIFTFL